MTDANRYAGYVDVRYLELAAELAREDKQLTYAAMHLQAGQRALDVGCGPGLDTIALAKIVGPSGAVAGVDADPAMIAEAERRAAELGMQDRIHHDVADALTLPFDADTFDAARSERLFQHLDDPAAALAELARVTRPGGWIAVLDTDYSTLTIDSDETDIERRLALTATQRVRSGYAARKLYRMFVDQGLTGITVVLRPQTFTSYGLVRMGWLDVVEQVALAAGTVTGHELERWRRSLEHADARGAFFASLNHILVSGRKP